MKSETLAKRAVESFNEMLYSELQARRLEVRQRLAHSLLRWPKPNPSPLLDAALLNFNRQGGPK